MATVLLHLLPPLVMLALPHQDVDLYLVQCNNTDPYQLWSLPADPSNTGGVLIRLHATDPVNHGPICLNCASDRCHGWTCSPIDGNNWWAT